MSIPPLLPHKGMGKEESEEPAWVNNAWALVTKCWNYHPQGRVFVDKFFDTEYQHFCSTKIQAEPGPGLGFQKECSLEAACESSLCCLPGDKNPATLCKVNTQQALLCSVQEINEPSQAFQL